MHWVGIGTGDRHYYWGKCQNQNMGCMEEVGRQELMVYAVNQRVPSKYMELDAVLKDYYWLLRSFVIKSP